MSTPPQHDGTSASDRSDTTLDELSHSEARFAARQECLALVIAHCAGEPWRIGALAFVPAGVRAVLGRGPAVPGDRSRRLAFGQQRFGGLEDEAPLSVPTISRTQLAISAQGGRLDVENLGRARLLHNDAPAQRAEVLPGDTLQLGRSLLLVCVQRSLQLPRPADTYRTNAFGEPDAYGIVGESPVVWRLRQQLAYLGPLPGHVLLLGPSGSGKELAARAIHGLSRVSARRLVARNAATIPEGIADAELFGNAKNYPNAGMPQRSGLVGEANGSTLFLDEFAELSPGVQASLLRVLDDGEYQALGEPLARRAAFRLIAATNRPESALRSDLLARFRFRIELPDLNARREDIPLLMRHLLCDGGQWNASRGAASSRAADGDVDSRISCELVAEAVRRSYVTNVRELGRWLSQAVSGGVEQGPILSDATPAPPEVAAPARSDVRELRDQTVPKPGSGAQRPLQAAEIQATLDLHNGVLETAWRALGLKNRHALSRLIARHGLEIRKRLGKRDGGS